MNYRKKFLLLFLTLFFTIFFFQISLGNEKEPVIKKEIVKLKYERPSRIYMLLFPFKSRKGNIHYNNDLNIMIISDYPENVAKMLELIKQCDVKPTQIEFKIWVILAEEREKPKSIDIPGIGKIVKELQSILKYNHYQLLDSSYLKTSDKTLSSSIVLGGKYFFNLVIYELKFVRSDNNINFSIKLLKGKSTLISSSLTLKNGETTVVGVSKMDGDNKGLILIITAKALQ